MTMPLHLDSKVPFLETRQKSLQFGKLILKLLGFQGHNLPGEVQSESVCVNGTGSTEGANRWADYSSTSVDPVDQCTFWHTNEYVETTGNFQWNTRVCSFRVATCGEGGGGPVNQPPSADFTFNCTDLSCAFDGTSSTDADGTITAYSWDFGDGSTATGPTPSHTYSTGGTFTVALTVTDDAGATDTVGQTVTVVYPNVTPIELTATLLSRGRVHLGWSGATGTRVDVFRNGVLLGNTRNDGWLTRRPGSGTFTYVICERFSTTVCSNPVTVTL